MTRLKLLILGSLALALAATSNAQSVRPTLLGGKAEATIYRDRNYRGPAVSSSSARANLALAWQARSIRIKHGTWQLCSRPNFEGRCWQVARSNANLPRSQRTVQSIRPAYQSGWQLIGERDVGDRKDRDTIVVWGHDRHKHLLICAERHAIRLYHVEVVFRTGGKHKVPVQALVLAGRCARSVDFAIGRDISLINLTYEALSLGPGAAVVQVFARK